jgi:hypothetical protein
MQRSLAPARFCEMCGRPLRAGIRFCGGCGAPVDGDTGSEAGSEAGPAAPACGDAPTPPSAVATTVIIPVSEAGAGPPAAEDALLDSTPSTGAPDRAPPAAVDATASQPAVAQAPPPAPPSGARRWLGVTPKAAVALGAVFLLLIATFEDPGRRTAAVRFIDDTLLAPVQAVEPLTLFDVFQSHIRPPCTFSGRFATCPSHDLWSQITRFPGAVWQTAGYVAGRGLIAVVVIGLPAALVLLMIYGAIEERSPMLLHPLLWLVIVPGAIAVVAWGLQLLLIGLLLLVKYTILSCAVLGVLYFVFERYKAWDEMRKGIDSVVLRLRGGRPAPPVTPAGPPSA